MMVRDLSRQEVLRVIAYLAKQAAAELSAGDLWDRDPQELHEHVSQSRVKLDELLAELKAQADRIYLLREVFIELRRNLADDSVVKQSDEFSPDDPDWVDVRTAAERFGIDETTIRKHIDTFAIGVKLGTGRRKRCYVSLRRARKLYSSRRLRHR